jgi:methylenetetrahydrofolate reductase (NADPH)
MHIKDIINKGQPSFSFEFFPPKSEKSSSELLKTIKDLESLNPSYVSITYGAGGTTRERTHELVEKILDSTNLVPIPHLTCVQHDEEEISKIINRYCYKGVSNILALRGDPPRDNNNYDRSNDAFQYACDLVKFIRSYSNELPDKETKPLGIGVAGFPEGHPETPNRLKEIDYLKAKIDSGADYICTQLFFDNHDFFDFRDRCILAGINVPIIAGIMPISSMQGLERMANLAGGSRFPAKLLKSLKRCDSNPASIEKVGIQYATEQCADLLNNAVEGIHFYTLNKSKATRGIFELLGINKTSK